MSHLTHEQLSALLDQRLGLGERGLAERHLQECRACRDAYHDLEAQDRRVARGLDHDPGDSYFSSFADVVQGRIEAEGAHKRRGVPAGPGSWFDKPMNLAYGGVAVAVVLGVGAALFASRHVQNPVVNGKLESRVSQVGASSEQPKNAAENSTAPNENAPEPAPVLGLTEQAAQQAKQYREADRAKLEASGAPGATGNVAGTASSPASTPAAADERAARSLAPAPAAAPVAAAKLSAAPSKDRDEEVTRRDQVAQPQEVRFCGNVHDAQGRALRFASVVLVRRNAAIQSDDRGRFCMYVSPGSDSLIVTLLGFKPLRRFVHLTADAADLNLQLDAMPTLTPSQTVSMRTLQSPALKTEPAPTVAPEDQIAALPDSVRQVADLAVRYSDVAARSHDAHQHDAAAGQWERFLRHAENGPLEPYVRGRIAEERYRAWEAEPNERRQQDAREALTAFLVRAPQGPERNRAALWLDAVTK